MEEYKVEHARGPEGEEDAGWGFTHSKAVLLLDPAAYAWLAPDPTHVFLPLPHIEDFGTPYALHEAVSSGSCAHAALRERGAVTGYCTIA